MADVSYYHDCFVIMAIVSYCQDCSVRWLMFLSVKIALLYGCCFLLSKMLWYVADVSYCQDCFVIWLMFLIVKIALLYG